MKAHRVTMAPTEVRPGVYLDEPLPEGVSTFDHVSIVYAEILCTDHRWRRVHGPCVKWHYVDGQLVSNG